MGNKNKIKGLEKSVLLVKGHTFSGFNKWEWKVLI